MKDMLSRAIKAIERRDKPEPEPEWRRVARGDYNPARRGLPTERKGKASSPEKSDKRD